MTSEDAAVAAIVNSAFRVPLEAEIIELRRQARELREQVEATPAKWPSTETRGGDRRFGVSREAA